MKSEVINKITITEEAVFDYTEALAFGTLDKRTLKAEVGEYIDHLNRSGRLLWDNYFRCKYLDENSGQMLMLFLYRAEKMSVMQYWNLVGICLGSEWDENDEYEGGIRAWVETNITELPDEDDWVVRHRVNKILNETEKTLFENVLEEVKNAFACERDKETAEKLAFLQSVYFEFQGRHRARSKVRKNRKSSKHA